MKTDRAISREQPDALTGASAYQGPAMVLYGASDIVADGTEIVRSRFPQAIQVTLQGSGHVHWLQNPAYRTAGTGAAMRERPATVCNAFISPATQAALWGAVLAGRPWWRARQLAAGSGAAGDAGGVPAAGTDSGARPVLLLPLRPAEYRQRREVGPGQGDAADADIDRDPALPGPVDVPQVEQQGELIHDERQAAAIADRARGVTAVPLLAADGDHAGAGQHADSPHVVMQVLAADADVAARPLPARMLQVSPRSRQR